MIDINLLPPEYAPKRLVSPINIVIIGVSFLIGLSLLLPYLHPSRGLLAEVQDYARRVDYYNQNIMNYKRELKDINELKERMKLLKDRLSLVKEILREKATWSDKLTELYQHLPQGSVWIDSFVIEHEDTKQRTGRGVSEDVEAGQIAVSISGGAVSVNKISQFVANLEESGTFSNVVLNSV